MRKFTSIIAISCYFMLIIFSANAQNKPVSIPYIPVSKPLYDSIARADSLLFAAFNAADMDKLQSMFTPDVEFYHDKGGLTLFNQTMINFKKMFAQNLGLKRTLVPGTLEVYPIKGFGAVETGLHQFCHIENGKMNCGIFKFVQLWKRDGDAWKLARVISYDH